MELNLPPEKQARLQHFATRTGKDIAQLVEEAEGVELADETSSRGAGVRSTTTGVKPSRRSQ